MQKWFQENTMCVLKTRTFKMYHWKWKNYKAMTPAQECHTTSCDTFTI